jgi:hypothetical protein
MRQVIFVILTTLAIVGGTGALSRAEISRTIPDLAINPAGVVCDLASTPDEGFADVMLLADRKREKYTCLEKCDRGRYRCERIDKNRPGSKNNIKASSKCAQKYNDCLNMCQ